MKTLKLFTYLATAILIFACSGSETYRGFWKATDLTGAKYEIVFGPKSFTVKDSTGKIETHNYSQNSVEIKNSIKTYGIQLGDGRTYNIYFPLANNDNTAVISDANKQPLYTISRKDYTRYEDVFKLN